MKDDKTIKSEYQATKEEIIEALKRTDTIQKESQEVVDSSVLMIQNQSIDLLKEENLKNYKKIKSLIKKIQNSNKVILKMIIAEEDFKRFKKEGKIHFTLNQKIDKKNLQQLETFNGKFISEKMLMTISYITGGITKDTLKYFNEDFELLEKTTKTRNKYQDQFYSLYDKISETNKELGKIRDSFFEDLPRTNYFDEEEGIEKNTIDLTNANTLEKFQELMTKLNEAIVDEIEMFEMTRLVDSQYKFDFKYDEETQTFDCLFTKDLNFTNKYLDISNPKIEELKGEIKRLQDKLKETEEPEEIKQFKPTPIEKVVSFNDKISNNFGNLENGTNNLIAKTGGKKKSLKDSDIQVYIENSTMTTSNPLEPFDRIVLQTIYSVLQENTNFDIQMLRKTMSGITNRNGTKLDDEIEKSINKLWTTLIEIKIPEELKQTFKDTDFEWESIKGTLLPLIELKGKKGGKQVKLYGLEANPIYYSYVKAKGQLQTKDTKLLQTGTATKENVLIIDYLTTRIVDMKHKKNCDDNLKNIKLESIWELIETEEDKAMTQKSLNQKRKRRQKDIEEILKNYVSIKYIKSYSKTKTGFKIEI
jgi:hypothetical protein